MIHRMDDVSLVLAAPTDHTNPSHAQPFSKLYASLRVYLAAEQKDHV